jgi:tetrapyrrole methylase family protein/MazG family protein
MVMDTNTLDGCDACAQGTGWLPWDREQDHRSIRANMIEEVYEFIEAVDNEDFAGMEEELGDIMMQVAFHARLAEEKGIFTMQDVIDGVSKN